MFRFNKWDIWEIIDERFNLLHITHCWPACKTEGVFPREHAPSTAFVVQCDGGHLIEKSLSARSPRLSWSIEGLCRFTLPYVCWYWESLMRLRTVGSCRWCNLFVWIPVVLLPLWASLYSICTLLRVFVLCSDIYESTISCSFDRTNKS